MRLTYRPQEGDPARVMWAGHVFEANVPRHTSHPEIMAGAPGNPWFDIEDDDGGAPKRPVQKAVPGWDMRRKPRTPEDYRAYAVTWINAVAPDTLAKDPEGAMRATAVAMKQRWNDEEDIRQTCGVGSDDLDLLAGHFNPKYAELGGK